MIKISEAQKEACARLELELRAGTGYHGYATPIDTADGREWWAEALKMEVEPIIDMWHAHISQKPEDICVSRDSRADAMISAILDAAEPHLIECSRCDAASEMGYCPYTSEIDNEDHECDCCSDCAQACAEDI